MEQEKIWVLKSGEQMLIVNPRCGMSEGRAWTQIGANALRVKALPDGSFQVETDRIEPGGEA